MAVTIDEMHVEVQESQAPTTPSTPSAEPKKDVDLSEAIEMLRERRFRLRAD